MRHFFVTSSGKLLPRYDSPQSIAKTLPLVRAAPSSEIHAVSASKAYRPDIDGIRAVAVTAVLLFHCGLAMFPGGYVGVDIFFVISGYLITGHLAAEIAVNGRVSIAKFYERRIRRIVPALVVVLIITELAAAWLLLPSYLVRASKALAAAAFSVSNVYLWRASNYFEPSSNFQPFLHTWSLSVEEQFYLFIPILMGLTGKLLRGRWLLLFGPLSLASFALSVYATTRGPTANFYLLPTRAWELGIGSLLATVPLPPISRRWMTDLVGAIGLMLMIAPVFLYNDATAFPGLNALCPCLGSAMLIYVGGAATTGFVTRLLGLRPFVAVGLISYSLYLVHWPLIALLRFRTVAPLTSLQIVLVLALSFALSTLCWRFVERPFRRVTPFLTRGRILFGGGSALVGAAALGLIGIETNGLPSRFPDFVERTIPGHSEWKPGRCFLEGDPDYRKWSLADCTRVATGPHKVLLWGDSFAGQYIPGMLAHADALRSTIIQYTAAGCPPVLSYRSYARMKCSEFNAHALDIIREQNIDTVIVAGRWTDMRQRGLGEIGTTLSALDAMGVRVLLIGQSPEFTAGVQVISFLKGSKMPDAVNRWNVFFPSTMNQQLQSLAGRNVFVDPMPVLCDGQLCTYQDHGTYLFEDYGHMSVEGSRRVVERLLVRSRLLDHPEPEINPN
jgi:peptidoglycan/LPS O-acetylase OafA/YrhL